MRYYQDVYSRFLKSFLRFLYRPLGAIHGLEDETRGWVGRSLSSQSITNGPAVLASKCVQADLSRCPKCWVRRAIEELFIGYRDV